MHWSTPVITPLPLSQFNRAERHFVPWNKLLTGFEVYTQKIYLICCVAVHVHKGPERRRIRHIQHQAKKSLKFWPNLKHRKEKRVSLLTVNHSYHRNQRRQMRPWPPWCRASNGVWSHRKSTGCTSAKSQVIWPGRHRMRNTKKPYWTLPMQTTRNGLWAFIACWCPFCPCRVRGAVSNHTAPLA